MTSRDIGAIRTAKVSGGSARRAVLRRGTNNDKEFVDTVGGKGGRPGGEGARPAES